MREFLQLINLKRKEKRNIIIKDAGGGGEFELSISDF